MYIAIIEWGSENGDREPELFLADDEIGARRAFVEFMTTESVVRLVDMHDIDAEWVAEHPTPDLDDADAVQEWAEAFKKATTDAWLSIYGPDQHCDKRTNTPALKEN